MIKNKNYSLILLAAVALSACHDDKSSPAPAISDKTYDAASGLELYYQGNPMPGKSVTFSQDGTKAKLIAFSKFDLSQLSEFGLSGEIPAPGVIPGSPQLTLTPELVETDGGWSFEATSSNDYCKFSYSGFATPEKLKLFINDVSLNTPVSPAVWTPAPIEKNNDGTFKSLPFYIEWQFTPIPDTDIDFSGILSALTTLPVIPVYNNTAYMSVSQAMTEVLRTIAFNLDGNIIFTYINNSFGAARIDQTQPNGYQYVIDSPTSVRLYINPLSFFSLLLNNASGGTPASDIDLNDHGLFPANNSDNGGNADSATQNPILKSDLAKKILKSSLEVILPQLADGIPLSFETTDSGMHLFIDTQTTMMLLEKIVLPLLQDDPTLKAIEEYLTTDPVLKPLLPVFEEGLRLLPQVFAQTNTIRLGFNFLPYTPAK